ncbi:MAG: hypothetical protein ABEH78_07910 [Haloferacaceae archaeon]
MRSTIIRARKAYRSLEMLVEDGATPAGEPPTDHIAAVLDADSNSREREVREAHANGNPPPQGGA